MGRTRTGPGHVVYGGHRGDTVQPGNQNILSALVWGGKSQEGGARRLYAQATDHAQCDAQASDALADGTASACLTAKTVADPGCSRLKPYSSHWLFVAILARLLAIPFAKDVVFSCSMLSSAFRAYHSSPAPCFIVSSTPKGASSSTGIHLG